MKILRNKQVSFILKAELTHLILIKISTKISVIVEETHMTVVFNVV